MGCRWWQLVHMAESLHVYQLFNKCKPQDRYNSLIRHSGCCTTVGQSYFYYKIKDSYALDNTIRNACGPMVTLSSMQKKFFLKFSELVFC